MFLSPCRFPLLFLFFPLVLSALVNVTIDDTFGDPSTGHLIQYIPTASWSADGNCVGCPSPDPSQTYLNTWHESLFDPKSSSNTAMLATIPFQGNAVYIYCILSSSQNSPGSLLTFYIDNQEVGVFTQSPQGQTGIQYDAMVYSNTTLHSGNHTLTIENGGDTSQKSILLLDYIIYSYDNGIHPNGTEAVPASTNGSTQTTSSSNVPQILGGVLGTLFILLFLGLAFVAYRRHKKGQPIIPTSIRHTPNLGQRVPSNPSDPHLPKRTSGFNPHLLVRKAVSKVSHLTTSGPPRPPPKPRVSLSSQGRPFSTELPYLNAQSKKAPSTKVPSTREREHQTSPLPLLAAAYEDQSQPRYPSGSSFSSKIDSIHRWQWRTMEETRGLPLEPPPLPAEDMLSYYEDNATESHRVKTPPPPPRRYTVMNN